MQIPFGTNSYKSESLPVSAQQTVNIFAEREPPDAKTQVALFGAFGITQFCDVGTGPVRGLHVMVGVLYAVSGSNLYSIDQNGNAVLLGTGIPGASIVEMSDNNTQLMIVTGALGFIYDLNTGFVQITDPDFYPCQTVTYYDGYFVFDKLGTREYFISGLLDGSSYAPLDFATAEVQTGFLLSTINQQENLLLFCQQCIETWYDSGAVDFPFARYSGATIERGCLAAKTPVKEDNSVFFLGNDYVFYRLDGVLPRRVSTHAIEFAWRQYRVVDDAFCFTFTRSGHKFVVLTFPSQPATWVYDISTGLWHERESFDQYYNSLGRWRANCHAFAYGQNMVGDAFGNNIGYMHDTDFTEFGYPIVAKVVAPSIHNDRKRIFFSRFELDVESGVGTSTGQGVDPQIMLDWSDDGARTWSAVQTWSSMGEQGQYRKRLRWLRLGQSRNRVYRITMSDPVRRTIIAAHGDMTVGF